MRPPCPTPTCGLRTVVDEKRDGWWCAACCRSWSIWDYEERMPRMAGLLEAQREELRAYRRPSYTLPPIPIGFEWVEDL